MYVVYKVLSHMLLGEKNWSLLERVKLIVKIIFCNCLLFKKKISPGNPVDPNNTVRAEIESSLGRMRLVSFLS